MYTYTCDCDTRAGKSHLYVFESCGFASLVRRLAHAILADYPKLKIQIWCVWQVGTEDSILANLVEQIKSQISGTTDAKVRMS